MLPNSAGATIAASVAMIAIVTSNSIKVNPSREKDAPRPTLRAPLLLNDTRDLLHCREPGLNLLPTVDTEWEPARGRGEDAQLCTRRTRRNGIAQIIRQHELLEHAEAAAKAGAATGRAPGAAPHRRAVDGVAGEQRECVRRGLVLFATVAADAPHEALRQHAVECRRDEIVRNAEVEQPRYRADRVVGVESAEHEVSCHGCLYRDLRRLLVAHLADHHHVGVLSENG